MSKPSVQTCIIKHDAAYIFFSCLGFDYVTFNSCGDIATVHTCSRGPNDCFFTVLPHWNAMPQARVITHHPSQYTDTGPTCPSVRAQNMTSHPVTIYRHRTYLSRDMTSHPSQYIDTGLTCHSVRAQDMTSHPVTIYRHRTALSRDMTSHPSQYTDTGPTCRSVRARDVTSHPVTIYNRCF